MRFNDKSEAAYIFIGPLRVCKSYVTIFCVRVCSEVRQNCTSLKSGIYVRQKYLGDSKNWALLGPWSYSRSPVHVHQRTEIAAFIPPRRCLHSKVVT